MDGLGSMHPQLLGTKTLVTRAEGGLELDSTLKANFATVMLGRRFWDISSYTHNRNQNERTRTCCLSFHIKVKNPPKLKPNLQTLNPEP